jgi:uncharacterized protein (TIGR03435 family)
MNLSTERRRVHLPAMRLIVCIAGCFLSCASPRVALAQSAAPLTGDVRFEVASVKPQLSPAQLGAQARTAGGNVTLPRMGIQTLPGGRFSASMVTLKQLVTHAFQVKDYQIEGGPNWLTSDYFEINALAGPDATPENVQAMLRSLLAERFNLRTRIETRQAPVFALTLARPDGRLGFGLKPTSTECQQQIAARKSGTAPPVSGADPTTPSFTRAPAPPSLDAFPATPTCGTAMMMSRANGASAILYGGFDLSALVSRVSTELAAPVVDRTGLSGLFDITLEYTSERQTSLRPPGLDTAATDIPPPFIVAAIEQQLGLKLEKQTGPLDFIVIESAEPPTPD